MLSNEKLNSLTSTEITIYNFVLKNKDKVIYMRSRDLADLVHASPASVVRFARKIGYDSFSEFKIDLKKQLKEENETKQSEMSIFYNDFFNHFVSVDYKTLIKESVELISAASLVLFIGNGSSGSLAEYGARQFSNVGKQTFFVKDPSYPFSKNEKNPSKIVTIALSVSGETQNIITQVNDIRENGGKIISITNNSENTLAKISDINIPYFVPQEKRGHLDITTQIPVIYILETLARTIYG